MGSKESLGRGSVQYMSAGRGVVHSEMNEGKETCRFIQVRWEGGRKRLGTGRFCCTHGDTARGLMAVARRS